MDRVFHRVPVTWPGTKITKGGEAQYVWAIDRHENGVALHAARIEPSFSLVQRHGAVCIDRCRVDDHIVVDGQNAGKVGFVGGTDHWRYGPGDIEDSVPDKGKMAHYLKVSSFRRRGAAVRDADRKAGWRADRCRRVRRWSLPPARQC